MVADFEDYAELHGGVTADAIKSAADDPNAHTATVQALIGDLADDDAAIEQSLEGDIAQSTQANTEPATNAARRLAQNGTYAIGLLNSFAASVATFDSTVDDLNEELRTNTSTRMTAQHHAEQTDEGGDSPDAPDPLSYEEVKAQEKAKLQGRYDQAVETLETEADSVAGKLESGPTEADVKALVLAGYIALPAASLWPNLHLTNAELETAQVNTVKNMSAEEQAEYVRTTKDIDPEIADVITPTAQALLADDVSDDIKNHDIDEDTTRIMALLKEKEPFAHALYSSVTPDEMGEAIRRLSNDAFPSSDNRPANERVPGAELYRDFLDSAGVSLATYTKAQGAYGPEPDLAETWFKAITDEEHPQNAAALTLLIKHGGEHVSFETEFLGDLTNKVYDWEQDHDGDPVWSPLNNSLGEGYGIKDPDIDYGDTSTSTDNVAGYKTPFDGLANLLGSMEHSPGAADRFFAQDGDGNPVGTDDFDGEQVNDKLKYLLTERTWPTDDGDGFGTALEAAATGDRSGPGPDGSYPASAERAATLASQTVHIIAGASGDSNGVKFLHDWHLQEGARDNIGRMLASYAPDVQRIANGDGDSIDGGNWIYGDDGSEKPYHDLLGLRASNGDLGDVLKEVGRGDNKDGITAVLTSQVVHNQNLVQDALDAYNVDHDKAPKTIEELRGNEDFMAALTRHGESNGTAISFVLSNGVEGGTDDEDARAARREMMSKAFSLGTEFVPTPGGKVASVLTSTALSEIGDAIGSAPEGKTADWGQSSERVIQDGLSYGTYNTLLSNHYLDEHQDPESGIPSSAVDHDHDPPRIRPELYNGESGDLPEGVEDRFNTWNVSNGESGNAPRDFIAPLLNGYSSKTSAWLGQ